MTPDLLSQLPPLQVTQLKVSGSGSKPWLLVTIIWRIGIKTHSPVTLLGLLMVDLGKVANISTFSILGDAKMQPDLKTSDRWKQLSLLSPNGSHPAECPARKCQDQQPGYSTLWPMGAEKVGSPVKWKELRRRLRG